MKPAFLLEAIALPLQTQQLQQYLARRIESEGYEQVCLSVAACPPIDLIAVTI